MKIKFQPVLTAVFAVVAMGAQSSPSFAYGPEGMFGGRPEPTSMIDVGNPVELKNDRPERAESVLDHPRPDYDPAPIEVGSFEVYPSLELGQTYDSNIYVQRNNGKEDFINTVRPIVNVFSNWNRHALSMTTFGDINGYDSQSHENYQNFVSDWNGRIDIMKQSWIAIRGGFQHIAESRSSPDATVSGVEPTTYDMAKAGIGYYRGIGSVRFTADYDMRRFDYNNGKYADRSIIDQSGRNHYEHVVGGRVSYDVSGNVKPYIAAHFNDHDYDVNDAMQSRGYDAVLGSTFDFGGITSLDLYAGAMEQNYRNSTLADKDILSPKFGGRIDWNVTGMTSVVLEASRTIEDLALTNFNSYIATGGSLTVTHELLRNLLIEGDASFQRNSFNGNDTRHDDNSSAGAGLRYFINRNVYSDLFYTFSTRSSTDSAAEYDRNLVMLRVGFRP